MSLKKVVGFLCLVVGLLMSIPTQAQNVNQQNFSNIRVDELTDDQIRQFMAQVKASGLSDAQLEQVAMSRGMSSAEIQKLRERVTRLQKQDQQKGNQTKGNLNGDQQQAKGAGRSYNFGQTPQDSLQQKQDTVSLAEQAIAELKSKIFGADLFKNSKLTFEPNLRLATPKNYQIGPDDQLLIDIYGYSEASYQLTVSPEGTINIPYVGVVSVAGMTIEQASSRIKTSLAKIYSGIRTGNTSVSIAIGNIRSIKVVLTGELVKPGTYTLPSLATVFNALYASGGPTENGSFRQIEIIRAGRKIATLDVYDFLLYGDLKNNVRLQDQDVIRVPTYRERVELVGQVKRPGIFEMLPGESLSDLIRFSGGFTERAYRARVKVLKNTETERRIADITSEEFGTYHPASGDKYFVNEILDRFENRVTIEGAVFRPGQYELEPGLTLGQLVKKAEGLREDAFQNRGYITRLQDNLQTELVSFDIGRILAGQDPDIPLKREDVINISSIFDLKEAYNVKVEGEVQRPGTLKFAEGMSLEDAIIQAGGLKESATPKRVEVARRVKNSNALSTSAQTAEVFQVDINQNLKAATQGFKLQPFDIVVVRPSTGYTVQKQVRIEGEVLYPGIYTLSRKDERVSDLVKRAGGFTAWAYAAGASLKRAGVSRDTTDSLGYGKVQMEQIQKLRQENQRLKQLQATNAKVGLPGINTAVASDTSKAEETSRNDFVGINLPQILKKPGGKEDIFLEEGDVITIPKQLQTVKVSGEVLSPVTVVYSKNKSFRDYISNGGGYTERAFKRRAYVIYANGSVKTTHKFLFFNNHPQLTPGAEIVVPKARAKTPLRVSEILGLTTSIVTLLILIRQFQ